MGEDGAANCDCIQFSLSARALICSADFKVFDPAKYSEAVVKFTFDVYDEDECGYIEKELKMSSPLKDLFEEWEDLDGTVTFGIDVTNVPDAILRNAELVT